MVKEKEKNKNRSKKGSKKCKIDIEPVEENSYEPSTPYTCKPLWDSESESEAEYVRGRKVRTINDSDSDSDSDNINISVKDNDCSKEKINLQKINLQIMEITYCDFPLRLYSLESYGRELQHMLKLTLLDK